MPGFARYALGLGLKRFRVGQLDNAKVAVEEFEETTFFVAMIALGTERMVHFQLIRGKITTDRNTGVSLAEGGITSIGPEGLDELVPRHFGSERNF